MKRKATLAGILLAMALALVLLPQAAQAETITLDGSQTTWEAGNTYQVNGDTRIDSRVSTGGSGDVTLQLDAGSTLNIPKGIYVAEQIHLKIIGPGKLVITGSDEYCAGIGANRYDDGGDITIENATVNVQGGDGAAGIGGGDQGSCKNITISDGSDVAATGGNSGAGIGAGFKGSCENITIKNHSNVTATGGEYATGIGGGYQGKSRAITIEDSTVTANAWNKDFWNCRAAGIGAGCNESGCGDIKISGSTVEATGGRRGAGIGGGGSISDSGAIIISNSKVTATAGENAAGIGGGENGKSGAIQISGGIVTATGGVSGIGNGFLYTATAESFQTGNDGKAVIFANGGINTNNNNEASWTGIIFDDQTGNVYGNTATPSDSFTIPEGSTLTVAKGKTLKINNPVTMTVNGNLIVNGKLDGDGTIEPDKFQPSFAAKREEAILYNGQAITIDRVLNTDERSVFNGDADPVYQWYDKDNQRLSDPPVAKGTYYVSATVGETSICKAAELPKTEFTIESKSIADDTISVILNPNEVTYNGTEQKPEVTVKDGETILTEGEDKDYTVEYKNNTNAGTATVTIIGKENYKKSKPVKFTINPKAIDAAGITVNLDPTEATYNGKEQKPEVTVKDGDVALKKDTDYKVTYSDNTNADTATVKVTGIGNYGGETSANFTIKPKDFTADGITVTLNPTEVIYNGKEQKPEVTVNDGEKILTKDKDYTVAYSDNTNAGTATVKVTGSGNYGGETSAKFTIKPKDFTADGITVTLNPTEVIYNGKEQKPEVTVNDGEKILTKDKDYTVNYDGDFINVGKPTVTVTGTGNYDGNKSADFTINQKTITADDIILTPNVTIYNGKAQKPAVKVMSGDVELTKDSDYTISWSGSDFTHPNTLTLTVRGKTPNCTGSATKDYTIREKRQKDHDTSSGSSSSGHHSSSDKKSDSSKKDDTQETGQTGDDTVAPTAAPETIFSDIHKGDWFYYDVCTVFQKGLMTGTGETTFEPQSPTTRAMLVAILHRMEGSPKAANAATFSDVAAGDWYAQAIAWAEAEGIADGYDAAHFGPNDAMTREQLAAFLMKYSAYKHRDVAARGDLSTFADAANVSDWAEDALRWAVATHLIGGKPDNLIAPQDLATRAELAAILTRYLG